MRLGIIGGLGPETSCNFCLNINNRFIAKTKKQPDIIMQNVPVPKEVEREIISGKKSPRMKKLLINSVKMLNQANADIIVIPCNTVHVFIEEIRENSGKQVLSIIEETKKQCKKFKTIGILGTSTTLNTGLYAEVAKKVIIPKLKEQQEIDKIILQILDRKTGEREKKKLEKIIKRMIINGAQAIVLGCTDLPLLITEADVPLINTMEVLEIAATKELIK